MPASHCRGHSSRPVLRRGGGRIVQQISTAASVSRGARALPRSRGSPPPRYRILRAAQWVAGAPTGWLSPSRDWPGARPSCPAGGRATWFGRFDPIPRSCVRRATRRRAGLSARSAGRWVSTITVAVCAYMRVARLTDAPVYHFLHRLFPTTVMKDKLVQWGRRRVSSSVTRRCTGGRPIPGESRASGGFVSASG